MVNDPQTGVRLSLHVVTDRIRLFLESLQSKRLETRNTYDRTLREFVRWYQEGFRFIPSDVEKYKHHLVFKKQLAEVSVSAYMTSLRQFCEYLVKEGVLTENPALHVGGGKRPSVHSRETLNTEDVTRFMSNIPREDELGVRDYSIAKLMVECGLAEIEIIRANVGDLQQRDGAALLFVRGKGKDMSEAVTLTLDIQESLTHYLSFRVSAMPEEPLFRSAGNRTKGMRMTTRGIRSRMNFHLERSGVKQGRARRITPHSLRHTAAVMMADAGATPEEIRQRLRLGTIATAMLYVNHKSRVHSASLREAKAGV